MSELHARELLAAHWTARDLGADDQAHAVYDEALKRSTEDAATAREDIGDLTALAVVGVTLLARVQDCDYDEALADVSYNNGRESEELVAAILRARLHGAALVAQAAQEGRAPDETVLAGIAETEHRAADDAAADGNTAAKVLEGIAAVTVAAVMKQATARGVDYAEALASVYREASQ